MPYWSIVCLYCQGEIVDALLECIPISARSRQGYRELFQKLPGAALACPYCSGLIGFNSVGDPCIPQVGWAVFRYGLAELELKKQADGEPLQTSIEVWALRHRFVAPGSHAPFSGYLYAEQSLANETVP